MGCLVTKTKVTHGVTKIMVCEARLEMPSMTKNINRQLKHSYKTDIC